MKRIAAINDISGFGRCSLSVAIPIISSLGVTCVPFPTSVFSRQTGFDTHTFSDLADNMRSYADDMKGESFDGIYTGFFSSADQISAAKYFTESHPETKCVVIDPVLGDEGEPYPVIDADVISAMRSFVKSADIITPNITELYLLADIPYNASPDKDEIIETARSVMNERLSLIIVTGVVGNGFVTNYIIEKDSVREVSSEYTGESFSGTGDIFASVVSGCVVKGRSPISAVILASKLIEYAVKDTVESGGDPRYGINFEKYLYLLNN